MISTNRKALQETHDSEGTTTTSIILACCSHRIFFESTMTQPQVPTNNDPEVALIDSGVQSPDGSDGSNSEEDIHGSSIAGAIFNFTNCIVGAGAIGLGGAIASSGGAISIALILFFGFLTKLSLDLVIRLSVETEGAHGSFEDLANVGLGSGGRMVVLACKLLYSFGCLVAYVVVVKDNMASAVRDLIYGDSSTSGSWLYQVLSQRAWFTWIISLLCILPLCLLRDMTPLASFSLVSVASMVFIVGIVIYIFFACPDIGDSGGSVYENWFEVRPGVLERYSWPIRLVSMIRHLDPFQSTLTFPMHFYLSAWAHLCLRLCLNIPSIWCLGL